MIVSHLFWFFTKKYSFISLCLKPEMWQKVAKFKGAEYFRKALYISIQTLYYETWNWDQVHALSIDHPWDVSTTWLESTCGKLNWLDMI